MNCFEGFNFCTLNLVLKSAMLLFVVVVVAAAAKFAFSCSSGVLLGLPTSIVRGVAVVLVAVVVVAVVVAFVLTTIVVGTTVTTVVHAAFVGVRSRQRLVLLGVLGVLGVLGMYLRCLCW